jgi:predicted tellurium resistance membrane protein TerC
VLLDLFDRCLLLSSHGVAFLSFVGFSLALCDSIIAYPAGYVNRFMEIFLQFFQLCMIAQKQTALFVAFAHIEKEERPI